MRFRKSVSALLMSALWCSYSFVRIDSAYAITDRQCTPDTAKNETKSDKGPDTPIDALPVGAGVSQETEPGSPLVEKYLLNGELKEGEARLVAQLKKDPGDDQTRFGLGVLQFLRAVERLAQDLYRYGMRDLSMEGRAGPFVRLPVTNNPHPQALSYHQTRKIAETFLENLARAESSLAPINDANVKLPLHFGLIRLDLNGDGRVGEGESLWKVYATFSANRNMRLEEADRFLICFDRGDVHWLRGYCHLLMAICEVYLAHDAREMFECTAHIFFTRVESPYKFLSRGRHLHNIGSDDTDLLDVIALIHLIRWRVIEPARMVSALHHLEGTVAQSKESWKWIMAESDDDHEWLPNPKQTGVLPGVHVTDEMVAAWSDIMDEAGKLLAGKLLIPFWRGDDGKGINLRKVFLEPRTLDLVLWVQGPAAAPYLEKGKMTNSETWRKSQQVFGRQLPGFAVWFN